MADLRFLAVWGAACGNAALVGVLSSAFGLKTVLPGVVVSFTLTFVSGLLMTGGDA